MKLKEGIEFVKHLTLWSKALFLGLTSYHFCKEVITNPRHFTDRTAEHVYYTFLFFDRTDWQWRELGRLIAYHRPGLALSLHITGTRYETIADMIRDPRFNDLAVKQEFLLFMDHGLTPRKSPDLLKMIRFHRPKLGAELDRQFTPR